MAATEQTRRSTGQTRRSALERAHSPQQERPLGGYGVLMATFTTLSGGFAAWFQRSGRTLPDAMSAPDFLLLTVASHKVSRMVTKDRVASAVRAPFTTFEHDAGPAEVNERARGHGLRRAIGELLVCPYCLGMWTSAGLTAMLLVSPRLTRWFASVLAMFYGTELLQMTYRRAEEASSQARAS